VITGYNIYAMCAAIAWTGIWLFLAFVFAFALRFRERPDMEAV